MIRKRLDNNNIKIKVIKKLPSSEPSSIETIYFKHYTEAIMSKYPEATTMSMMMPNINDLGSFRSKNVPSYGSLPIFCDTEEVRSVHGKDEHLHITSLYDGAEVYTLFIKQMMGEK